jgi:hypothetical protein
VVADSPEQGWGVSWFQVVDGDKVLLEFTTEGCIGYLETDLPIEEKTK